MSRERKINARGVLELTEEAVHLLRVTPLHLLLTYYIGAVPFVLSFLFFWADMSRSALAQQRCVPAAFTLAILFVWMKTWQAIFAAQLRAQISTHFDDRWNVRRVWRIAVAQAVIQTTGLFLIPAALGILFPFAWVYAFYQNATATCDGTSPEIGVCVKKAAGQSRLWQMQNHLLIGLLGLVGFFVFLNVCIAVVQIPMLLKMFLGIETAFTKSGAAAMNSTFFATALAVAYLCMDPVVKAVYVLRCFYGESLTTGDDLRAELMARKKASAPAVVTAVIIVMLCVTSVSRAETVSGAVESPQKVQVSPTELNQSLKDVLSKREFAWRLPREQLEPKVTEPKGWFGNMMDNIGGQIERWQRAVRDWFRRIGDWMDRQSSKSEPVARSKPSSPVDLMVTMQALMYVLIAVILCVIAVLLLRLWKQRSKEPKTVLAEAIAAQPDLNDENVVANQLPEDGWLKMARELIEQGNFRLALRALYLASLAHLAQREMITIAKFKSNLDYQRELLRRARALPELQTAFTTNVAMFDRTWYGMHEVTSESLQEFRSNFERIRAC